MSMMRCDKCSNLIDTDLDVECWVDAETDPQSDRCLCPACRVDLCETCHGTGQVFVGTSGSSEDGNAPEFERCEDCEPPTKDCRTSPVSNE